MDGQEKILIDCDHKPLLPGRPSNWRIEKHKKAGWIEFDPKKISLYMHEKQKKGGIYGTELWKELDNEPVLNANVLDYLLVHQELIPDSWKEKYISFWGTIYCDKDGYFYVRTLFWCGSKWFDHYCWLNYAFNEDNLAAVYR